MKETIISFKTAELAKEKGFAEKSIWYYDNMKLKYGSHTAYYYQQERRGFVIECVEQSQLQTWLRNKKILVEVRPVDDWNHWCYSISMKDCMSPFFEIKNNNEYPSYEDALEAGLYEGLTNIK